jgi:hypothetical protein
MKKPTTFPKVELIENDQIILVTQRGDVDYKKARKAIEGVLHFLDKATHITHLVSDMTDARLLPEAGVLTSGELVQRMEAHPLFGISTIALRTKDHDSSLENVIDEYNKKMWKERILSPSGEYKRSIIYFDSVEEAKNFLLTFNEMWQVLR